MSRRISCARQSLELRPLGDLAVLIHQRLQVPVCWQSPTRARLKCQSELWHRLPTSPRSRPRDCSSRRYSCPRVPILIAYSQGGVIHEAWPRSAHSLRLSDPRELGGVVSRIPRKSLPKNSQQFPLKRICAEQRAAIEWWERIYHACFAKREKHRYVQETCETGLLEIVRTPSPSTAKLPLLR